MNEPTDLLTDGHRPRTRRQALGLLAAGVAAGVALAGFGVAAAQSDTPTTAPSGASGATGPAGPRAHGGRGPGGPGGPGHGIGGKAIHSEYVIETATDGVFQTRVGQTGVVTAVSPTSLAVKSEDGYDRTYVVTADTKVNRDGTIADITVGETVHVDAVLTGATATAARVHDGTRPAKAPAPAASASTTST